MLRRISLVACIVVAASAAVRADYVYNDTGLTNPSYTITFNDDSKYANYQEITTQYAADYGVTFHNPATYTDTENVVQYGVVSYRTAGSAVGNFNASSCIANYMDSSPHPAGPIEITFANSVTGAGAWLGGQPWSDSWADGNDHTPTIVTLTAYLDGTQVAQYGNNANFWWATKFLGIDGVKFNKLVISTNAIDGCVLLDNLQVRSVPEPATGMLLGTGIIGLLAYAWRKRK